MSYMGLGRIRCDSEKAADNPLALDGRAMFYRPELPPSFQPAPGSRAALLLEHGITADPMWRVSGEYDGALAPSSTLPVHPGTGRAQGWSFAGLGASPLQVIDQLLHGIVTATQPVRAALPSPPPVPRPGLSVTTIALAGLAGFALLKLVATKPRRRRS